MTKQQIEITIIVVGVVLIGILLTHQFLMKKKPMSAATASVPTGAVTPGNNTPATEITFELPPLSEAVARKQKLGLQAPWGRNPFVLKSKVRTDQPQEEAPLSGLSVSAIVMKGNVGTAIVSGEIVRERDTLRGYRVVKIDTKGVVLEKGGETVVITYGK